jgi:putative lipoprotein
VAALALTGCTQNNAAPAESSSSSAAPAAPPPPPPGVPAVPRPAPAPATPSAGAADPSAPITFDESNQHLTIPAGVTKVIVNGSNNAIEGGSVADITVNGSNNDIHVEALTATAAFTGSNNTITFEKATNFKVTSDTGANNTIEGVE